MTPSTYPEGFFTELVRRHDWPPGFKSQVAMQTWSDVDRRESAARGRETQLANGHTGAVLGMSKRADAQVALSRPQFNARLGP